MMRFVFSISLLVCFVFSQIIFAIPREGIRGIWEAADKEIEQGFKITEAFSSNLMWSPLEARLPICNSQGKAPFGYRYIWDTSEGFVLNCVAGICSDDPSVLYFGTDSWLQLGVEPASLIGMHCRSLDDEVVDKEKFVRLSLDGKSSSICQKPILQLTLPVSNNPGHRVVDGKMMLASNQEIPKGWLIAELRSLNEDEGDWYLRTKGSQVISSIDEKMTLIDLKARLPEHDSVRMILRLSDAGCQALREKGVPVILDVFDARITENEDL